MRKELFHMERDVLNIGDSVTIIEGQLPFSYYYTIVPALAMSKNYKNAERIKSREGKDVYKRQGKADGNTEGKECKGSWHSRKLR